MVIKRLDVTVHIRKMVLPTICSTSFFQSVNEEPIAILFYDNCSAHPQELVSDCGSIICRCLPSNTTGLFQPMDQGPINQIKDSYKIKAINKALIQMDKNTAVGNMFDKFTIKG